MALGAGVRFFPERASSVAGGVDRVFGLLFWTSAFFLALIVVLTVVFVVRYRRRPSRPDPEPSPSHSTRLELLWTIVPLAIVFAIFAVSTRTWSEMTAPAAGAGAAARAGHRAEVVVVVRSRRRQGRARAAPREGAADGARARLDRRHPLAVPAGLPPEAGRGARPVHADGLHPDPARELPHRVRGVLRHRPLADGRRGGGPPRPGLLRRLVARGERGGGLARGRRGSAWRRRRAAPRATASTARAGSARASGRCGGARRRLADGTRVQVDEAYVRESLQRPGAKIVAGVPAGDAAGACSRRSELQALVRVARDAEGGESDRPRRRRTAPRRPRPRATSTHGRGARSWLFTLDHKRIGVMYLAVIVPRLPARRGLRALVLRLNLWTPRRRARLERHLQPALHAARRDHGVPVHHPGHPRVARQLRAAAACSAPRTSRFRG